MPHLVPPRLITGIGEVISTPVAVVGSGIAGLSAAISLGTNQVCLISRDGLGESGSSAWAQGGIAAALGPDDSPALHAADTLAVGAGLSDPIAVKMMTGDASERIAFLRDLGAHFDCRESAGLNADPSDPLSLGLEAGHSRFRTVHARGDGTGAEIVRALRATITFRKDIQHLEYTQAIDLLVDNGRIVGLIAERKGEQAQTLIVTSAVVLATGGLGGIFSHTTNPIGVQGDGLAIAARAGARLIDLEFIQFHPTALATGDDPMPLITEALRGEGATLLTNSGERFMSTVHQNAELAPRDIVARAIWCRTKTPETAVYLDARAAIGAAFPERFPTVFMHCQNAGIDPRIDTIPVAPAAHYHMGGIDVGYDGKSSIPGLWAAGEVACTGAHGANRLAGNSLLEAIVMGSLVARDIMKYPTSSDSSAADRALAALRRRDKAPRQTKCELTSSGAEMSTTTREIRDLMWRYVGVIRDHDGLTHALNTLRRLRDHRLKTHGYGHSAQRSLLDIAYLVTTAALARKESRGAHHRRDFDERGVRYSDGKRAIEHIDGRRPRRFTITQTDPGIPPSVALK